MPQPVATGRRVVGFLEGYRYGGTTTMLSFARVRAIAVLGVLLVGALFAIYLAMSRDSLAGSAAGPRGCPADSVPATLELPGIRDLRINVYNGTDQAGLASSVAEDFANRDFEVLAWGDHEVAVEDQVAVLRYGPEGVGAAHVLRAYFLNTATVEFDIEREGDTVDVVLGTRFRQLATPTEVRQSIAALGNPEAPPGTCAS